ncbi:MAG: 23S rRNA (guanosine(2251)-2'-O)-methyltransferase RlmB [Gammaproteobacteria bacterium]|jgi:23S rRNA (guanosine2251-2'-O)-methyltransferase|nr:23S rRNA (guanosine(2251)-2'-O)-methyltransferase RlmB [Gammaproteobacteria bacterium]
MSKSQYITGLRAVEQILATESTDIRRIYAEYQTANPRVEAVIKMARQNNIEIQPANRARLMQISGESRHQGVVAEVRRSTLLDEAGLRTMVEERLQEGRPILLLVLDGVQDPHNLGACMRTADAAGVDAVIVPRHGAAGLGPTVSKVAAGAAEQLPFVPVGNLGRVLGWLGDYGVRCVGTSDKADSTLFEADLSGSVALIMGREHTGLSKGIVSRCDTLVSLPMQGVVSSLNVSVATGICLYEIVRQRSGTN